MIDIAYEGYSVARLAPNDIGALELTYDPRWLATHAAFPVSTALPLRISPHSGEALDAWIASLSAGQDEGAGVAALVMLDEASEGGLSFRVDAKPDLTTAASAPLDADAISTLGERGAFRTPALLDSSGALVRPGRDAAATHWLALEDPARRGRLENQAFCLELARRCSLPVADFRSAAEERHRFLLIARPDRARSEGAEPGEARTIRLHLESFAVAAGRAGALSHQRARASGLGYVEMFAIADAHFSATDRLKLLDALIFRVLINDLDHDGGDLGLVLTGGARLAPITAMAACGPWPRAERRLPHRFDDKRLRADQLRAEHWRAMAKRCGLNQTFTLKRVGELAEEIAAQGAAAVSALRDQPALNTPILDFFRRETVETSAMVAANLSR